MNKSIAKLKSKKQIAKSVWEFVFEMVLPKTIEFKAGQYIAIVIDQKTRRQYSISSSPLFSKHEFSIVIDITPNGVGTKFLSNLDILSKIEFIGPTGNFVLPEILFPNLYFISTGTGISPLKSIIETLILNKSYVNHNIYIHFGTRYINDLLYVELFDGYFMEGLIKDYEKYLSRESTNKTINGYVTQFIPQLAVNEVNSSQFFICGGQKMVKSASDMLLEKGVSSKHIFYEKFY